MKVLAIETSCDETAAAVVDDELAVRSSVVASQIMRVYETVAGAGAKVQVAS